MSDQTWQEITEEHYYYLLKVVPPAVYKNGAFAVGETIRYTDDGPIHDVCCKVGGRYFTRIGPLFKFNSAIYTAEIRAIFFDNLE